VTVADSATVGYELDSEALPHVLAVPWSHLSHTKAEAVLLIFVLLLPAIMSATCQVRFQISLPTPVT